MQDGVSTELFAHILSHSPKVDEKNVHSLEDLTADIELYNAVIGLGQYDKAHKIFVERLDDIAFYQFSAARQQAEWLGLLFLNGADQLPPLKTSIAQGDALNNLALAYDVSGRARASRASISCLHFNF